MTDPTFKPRTSSLFYSLSPNLTHNHTRRYTFTRTPPTTAPALALVPAPGTARPGRPTHTLAPTTTSIATFGFIITRHVQTEKQNLYWNRCIYQLRRLYGPGIKIVIIDDASNQSLVVAHAEYENVEIIQSEYPGRGELLPYVYYFRRGTTWFQTAIIIHDSVFFHRRYDFSRMTQPVTFLWHHEYDYDNLANSRRMLPYLTPATPHPPKIKRPSEGSVLYNAMMGGEKRQLHRYLSPSIAQERLSLCFGAMAVIQHTALCRIEANYSLTRLANVIRCRTDRCTFERIFGVIVGIEFPQTRRYPSLFGDITTNHYKSFSYTFDEYVQDATSRGVYNKYGVVKVWTGR